MMIKSSGAMKLNQTNLILLFFLFVAGIQLGLHQYLVNREILLTPVGHQRALKQLDTYYPDIIRQSKMGRWAVIDAHSTQPTPPVVGYVFFIVAGKIAAVFNIEPVEMYELLRITGSVAVYIATFLLITRFLPQQMQLLSILFTLAIETGPQWSTVFSKPFSQWVAASPTQFILERHFAFPHHLWGEAFGLLLLYLVHRAITTHKKNLYIFIAGIGFFGTATLPSYFVIITAGVLLPWILYALFTKSFKQTFFPVFIAVFSVLLAGLWVKYEFAKGPPWNALVAVEKSWWTNREILIPFAQSFTLFYPFILAFLMCIPKTIRSWSPRLVLAAFLGASWSIVPIVLIVFSKIPWFPVANGRIASNLSPVPFGIVAAIGAFALWQQFKHNTMARIGMRLVFLLYIAGSLVLSRTYFMQTLALQKTIPTDIVVGWTTYPTNAFWNGIIELKKIPPFSHVMMLPRTGEMITAYVPLRVYQTQPLTFTNWIERRQLAGKFYSGTMNPEEVRSFIATNGLSYVFYGPEERFEHPNTKLYPDILSPIFNNEEVTIYKITL